MIDKLTIKNFKVHAQTNLILGKLNILTGINGTGKSSVLQSLLLLRQSFLGNTLSKGLQLNKPLCDIGFIKDAIYQNAESDEIGFSIEFTENRKASWVFKLEDYNYNKTFIPILEYSFTKGREDSKLENRNPYSLPEADLESLSIFNDDFQYLSAARWSPRESYPLDTNAVERKRQISLEKGQGELVAHFLSHYGKDKKMSIKLPSLQHESEPSTDLLSQVIAWEREISPGVIINPERTGKSFALKYSFLMKDDILPTMEFGAENVGFGVSYSLPIIVAALSSAENCLILIENPEAHLHPRAQSHLANLLALAAQGGAQIIIETHSEHIINGILVACKRFENESRGIDKNHVKIYHFIRDEARHCAIPEEIKILSGGKIDKQPTDFFEQTEKDLHYLLGL